MDSQWLMIGLQVGFSSGVSKKVQIADLDEADETNSEDLDMPPNGIASPLARRRVPGLVHRCACELADALAAAAATTSGVVDFVGVMLCQGLVDLGIRDDVEARITKSKTDRARFSGVQVYLASATGTLKRCGLTEPEIAPQGGI
jgi:hypothetical protein